jgi:uncharacterized membrane protein
MIKKYLFFLSLILLAAIFLSRPIVAQEINCDQNSIVAQEIKSFQSDIEIKKDDKIVVTETIDICFNPNIKETHRFIRTIPIKYQDKWGNNYSIKIKALEISNKWGTQSSSKAEISEGDGNLIFKIGDPNVVVNGLHRYTIIYEVKRVIIFGKNGQDEFYWNVTGNEWPIPVTNISGKVILPPEIDKNIENYCWTGGLGLTAKNCQISATNNIVNFTANDFLTISVKFPTGVVQKPTMIEKFTWFLKDNWIGFLPILAFIFMFLIWFLKGRDPTGRGTIIAEFESPDNLRPTEAGLLYDNKIQAKDITATIVDLAVKGYIKIIEKEDKKYDLLLINKQFSADKELKSYEIAILTDIFGERDQISLDDLKNKFYKYLEKIKKDVAQGLVENAYYKKNPIKVRNFWIGLISILSLFGFFLIGLLGAAVISYFISLLIVLFFGLAMTKRTPKGAEALEKIKGLRLYIDTAEKYRVKFQEKENIFEKFLPYAMIFGLADKWAKAFEGIYKNPPSWYEGYHGTFTTLYFVNSMNSFNSTVSTNITASPSSGTGSGGSGGFSGGGFGGGGGGFD